MRAIVLLWLSCLPLWLLGQEALHLNNPSFEGFPRGSTTPVGWYDCGFEGETPPDTHPSGAFSVYNLPQHGNTYIGMVTRDNETLEGVGQVLRSPLKAQQCYNFKVHLARSDVYLSPSKITREYEQYTNPIVLRIWGGNSYCDKKELLDETGKVNHTDWRTYEFKFNPKKDYRYILLEVFYKVPILFPYNGNLLLDNCSAIIACGEEYPPDEELLAENLINVNVSPPLEENPVEENPTNPPDENPTPPDENPIIEGDAENPGEKLIPELNRDNIEAGQIIRVNQIYFEADTFNLSTTSYPVLDEIFRFLKENDDIVVEIGGHTNGLPPHDYCDKLSANRARIVAEYLTGRGIRGNNIRYKGYGKRQPIAENNTLEGRKKNQRVEIKIVSIGGG